jgi:hypothetical protein
MLVRTLGANEIEDLHMKVIECPSALAALVAGLVLLRL